VAGKLVVDAMNYWPPVDGVEELFDDARYGSSELVQQRLDRSTVVKTLNHIGYHELDADVQPRPVFGVSFRRPEFERALHAEAA
jgi:predicted dinucleotide-binding enzyme